MATQLITVLEVSGQAWIRESDGSMVRLQKGSMEIPADAEIVTAEGASLQWQSGDQSLLEVSGGRTLWLSTEWLQADVEPADHAVMPSGSDAAAILTALQADFEGGEDSSFASLASLIETTIPLGLEYPGSAFPAAMVEIHDTETLDLADLLQGEFYSAGEEGVTDIGNLGQYLHFGEEDGSTVISISSQGGFEGGVFDEAKVDQVITLDGVSLQDFAGDTHEQEQMIKNLIDQGKLNVDSSS